MRFIDSHCHLHDPRVVHELEGISQRAAGTGVEYMVSCATAEDNFKLTAQISEQYKSVNDSGTAAVVLPCFGIHPWFVDSLSSEWKKNLENHLLSCLSGVGETGLDFVDKNADRDRQIQVFEYHLTLARELKRPINIHIRKAWDTFIHMLKRIGPLETPGLVHSYSGSADMISVLEKYGLYLSFSGAATNPGSVKVVSALSAVSKERFVLETDSPDILPYFDGKRIKGLNEPANMSRISEIAASRINMNPDLFSRQAYDNSLRLFEPLLNGRMHNES